MNTMTWLNITAVLIIVIGSIASAREDIMKPQWHLGDTTCPKASFTDRYINVPLFHDLQSMADLNRIPGLNVFKAAQIENSEKQIRIYYELFNGWDPQKKFIILIPGGPGQTHADFHRLAYNYEKRTDLLKKFNVIAMDHRGVGCSRPLFPGNEPPESMLMRQAASDIEMIRKKLVGQEGQINVWGYSYGSLLAQTYALLYPTHVERLFLGGTASSVDDWHMAGLQYESMVLSAVKPETRDAFLEQVKDLPEVREAFLDWSFEYLYQFAGRTQAIPLKLEAVVASLADGKKASVLEDLATEKEISPWMQRSIACIELFPYTQKYLGEYPMWDKIIGHCSEFKNKHEYFDYFPLLRQINVPTLIYGGAFDHVTPAKAMIRMAQEIKGSLLYIDNYLGHGFGGKIGCVVKLTGDFFSGASNDELMELSYSPVCQDPPRP
jgi:pimeloyl-ACP methyl ester carboxylesterase